MIIYNNWPFYIKSRLLFVRMPNAKHIVFLFEWNSIYSKYDNQKTSILKQLFNDFCETLENILQASCLTEREWEKQPQTKIKRLTRSLFMDSFHLLIVHAVACLQIINRNTTLPLNFCGWLTYIARPRWSIDATARWNNRLSHNTFCIAFTSNQKEIFDKIFIKYIQLISFVHTWTCCGWPWD